MTIAPEPALETGAIMAFPTSLGLMSGMVKGMMRGLHFLQVRDDPDGRNTSSLLLASRTPQMKPVAASRVVKLAGGTPARSARYLPVLADDDCARDLGVSFLLTDAAQLSGKPLQPIGIPMALQDTFQHPRAAAIASGTN